MAKRKLTLCDIKRVGMLSADEMAAHLLHLRNRLVHADTVSDELKSEILYRFEHIQWRAGTDTQTDLIKQRFRELAKACLARGIPIVGRERNKSRQRLSRFFRLLELSSRIIPPKARKETFEPAYNDVKADWLAARKSYKTSLSRKWLAFCFCVHVGVIVCQCLWGMCGDKVRRLFLSFLPDVFRRLWGS